MFVCLFVFCFCFFFSRKFESVGTFKTSGRDGQEKKTSSPHKLKHKLNYELISKQTQNKIACLFKVYFKPEFIFSNYPWLFNISQKNGAENLDVFCQIYPTIIQVGYEI